MFLRIIKLVKIVKNHQIENKLPRKLEKIHKINKIKFPFNYRIAVNTKAQSD